MKLIGYDTGLISGIIEMKNFKTDFSSEKNKELTTRQISEVVSILSVGTFIGSLIAGPCADNFGRRLSLIFTLLVFSFGVCVQTFADAWNTLLFGRFIAGIGVGSISDLIPLYQSEISPRKLRYLIKHSKSLAEKSLSKLWGEDIDSEVVLSEVEEIEVNFKKESLIESGYVDLIKKQNLNRTIIAFSIQMFQQLSGINFIFYYGVTFFKSAGLKDPYTIQIITGVVNMLSTIPGMYLVENIGRRQLLITGSIIMLAGQLFVGIFGEVQNNIFTQFFLIFSVCLFIFGFAMSWGPCAWVVTSEVFSFNLRSKGLSLSTATNWLFNFILALVTPYLVDSEKLNLGTRVGFLWSIFIFFGLIFVYYYLPETAGLSLEEIDEMFKSNISPRASSNWKVGSTNNVEVEGYELIDRDLDDE
ncbi:hypothetical protein HDU92_007735 [Lobulomyces angularis]|nr:hypothetical protein HDU92_007735 [Lobulomyces angularis]